MTRQHSARSGQALLIFGIMSVVIIGSVALVTDGGITFVEKRKAQGGADLVARAGALAKGNGKTDAQVYQAMSEAAVANGYSPSEITMSYVNGSGTTVSAVGAATPSSSATGVRATVTHSFNTFFSGFLGHSQLQTTATAAIGLGGLATIAGLGDSPFIICGSNALRSGASAVNLLDMAVTPPVINAAYVGTTFRIHDSKIGHDGGGCGGGSSFKGLASSSGDDNCAAIPCNWATDTGTKAGPTRTKVANQTGCSGDTSFSSCLMIIPIGIAPSYTPLPAGCTTGSGKMCAVAFGLFQITNTGSNSHTATLLNGSAYLVLSGSGGSGAPSPASCTACPQVISAIE